MDETVGESSSCDAAANGESTRLRWLELILVLSTAFAAPLFAAFYIYRTHRQFNSNPNASLINAILHEGVGIAVLYYVLYRQGRNVRSLGLSFRWKDIGVAIGLMGLANLAIYLFYLLIYYLTYITTGQLLTANTVIPVTIHGSMFFGAIAFVILNGFFEELIVRAYLMKELAEMTGGTLRVVASSVLFQSLYHLYQGIPSALSLGVGFLVFALYYQKSGRIFPVILAHIYIDVAAVIALRHH